MEKYQNVSICFAIDYSAILEKLIRYICEEDDILRAFVQWFTDFGDQGIVLPMLIVLAATLAWRQWWKGVLAWCVVTFTVLGTMMILKLAFGACGWEVPYLNIMSPSGHTAATTMLYAGICYLYWRWCFPGYRTAFIASMIAVLIAASRLYLHYHTVEETLVGAFVGVAGVCALRGWAGQPPNLPKLAPLFCFLVIVGWQHGRRLPAEQQIHSFVALRLRALICPVPKTAAFSIRS